MLKCICRSGVLVAASSLSVFPTYSYSQGGLGALYTVVVPTGDFGSANFARHLVSSLASVRAFCGDLDNSAYQVDCLAERFSAVSDSIPEGTDYDEVRALLNSASQDMAKLARNNRDWDLPRGQAAREGGAAERTTRPLTPVSAEVQEAVNRQAIFILEEVQTQLLRSASGSQSRYAQYAQIAQAIDSSKVLLRS
ncbi:hypothetical protein DL239_12040 [Sedimentitalea sp. CY04]|uniref:Uncharacterized protein n=2 Tax=Parasedimentitalea denitrificans TaxID=2211118 RepID=A0ABX0WAK5_9RHOB|nr:hypothetical protein [Sedimentitalea sp. CY04]